MLYKLFQELIELLDFDPLSEVKVLDIIYKDLKSSNIYDEHFIYFSKLCGDDKADPNMYMNLENSFTKYIQANPEKSKELKKKINKYFHILTLIEYIIEFDKKYIDYCFLEFFKRFSNAYNSINKTDEEIDDVEIYFDNQIGIVEIPDDKPIKPNTPPTSGGDVVGGGKGHKYNILDIIEKRNEEEEEIGKLIEDFEQKIDLFFKYVREHKDFSTLKAKMKSVQFGEDEIYSDFRKIYNSFVRRKKKEVGEFFVKETKDIVDKLCDDFEESIRFD